MRQGNILIDKNFKRPEAITVLATVVGRNDNKGHLRGDVGFSRSKFAEGEELSPLFEISVFLLFINLTPQ